MHIKINDYDYIKWEEYQGKPQLTVYYQTKSGEYKPKYIKQEFGKGNWKDVPLRITFESEEAVKKVFSKDAPEPDDSIPF